MGNVSLTWTVTEPESPASLEKTGCVDQTITADQSATTYSCSASSDGGEAGPVNVSIKRDGTVPTPWLPSRPPTRSQRPPTGTTWPRAHRRCPLLATTTSPLSPLAPPSHTFVEGADQSQSGVAKDNAGNSSAPAGFSGINVDLTGPTVTVTGVADGGVYTRGQCPDGRLHHVRRHFGRCHKRNAGHDWWFSQWSGLVHRHVLGCQSTMQVTPGSRPSVHQSTTAACSGILQPINPDNTSIFKRGQAVPVKFKLPGTSTPASTPVAGPSRDSQRRAEASTLTTRLSRAVSSNTPATTFRYDSSADQYIYNADMKSTTVGSCYMFRVTLDSSQMLDSAIFKMAK